MARSNGGQFFARLLLVVAGLCGCWGHNDMGYGSEGGDIRIDVVDTPHAAGIARASANHTSDAHADADAVRERIFC